VGRAVRVLVIVLALVVAAVFTFVFANPTASLFVLAATAVALLLATFGNRVIRDKATRT
jgi:predicted lysophospholipase L1 biosynthesis ABC-type transport system permease subunit